jgi:hypothetical protein
MQNNIGAYFEAIIHHLKKSFNTFTFRFSDLKTSTQISLKFTLFTMLQVLLFSILANGIFFENRYNKQQGLLPPTPGTMMIQKMVLGRNRLPETEIFDIDSPE